MRFHTLSAVAASFLSLAVCSMTPVTIAEPETGLEPRIEQIARANSFNGVILVSRPDEPQTLSAFGKPDMALDDAMPTDASFNIASITKSFTAALTLKLVEQGKLSLEDTLQDHLPDLDIADADKITVRHLLQNRSGLAHTTDIPGWFDPEWKDAQTPDSFLAAASALPLKSEPGSEYYYSNIGYYLLGLIIDHATGSTYENVLTELVLAPLGLTRTGQIYDERPLGTHALNYLPIDGELTQITLKNTWMFRASASLYSTAEDLLTWSDALQSGKLVSADSMKLLFDADAPMAWIVGEISLSDGAEPTPVRTYNGDLAGYTTILSYFPDTGVTVILLGNTNPGYDTVLSMTLQIAAAALH